MDSDARAAGSSLYLTRIASFVAIGLVVGVALSAVPNVELVTAVCFCSGYLLGPMAGLLTGGLTEGLFAGFNPVGTSAGLLLVAQVAGMAMAGLIGAIAAIIGGNRVGFRLRLTVVISGILATLFFDLVTNLAFPITAGFSLAQTLVSLGMALPFTVIHLGSNVLVFSLLVVPFLAKLKNLMAAT
jgi:hypothetical protein